MAGQKQQQQPNSLTDSRWYRFGRRSVSEAAAASQANTPSRSKRQRNIGYAALRQIRLAGRSVGRSLGLQGSATPPLALDLRCCFREHLAHRLAGHSTTAVNVVRLSHLGEELQLSAEDVSGFQLGSSNSPSALYCQKIQSYFWCFEGCRGNQNGSDLQQNSLVFFWINFHVLFYYFLLYFTSIFADSRLQDFRVLPKFLPHGMQGVRLQSPIKTLFASDTYSFHANSTCPPV